MKLLICWTLRGCIQSGNEPALVSLNMGVATKETFTDQFTANISQLPLNTLIFQDDISKINDDIEARE